MSDKELTHLNADGSVHMVDVGEKKITARTASARTKVELPLVCVEVLAAGGDTKKGNVFEVARLAGIMAAKQCSHLIPLCHQVPLSNVAVEISLEKNQVHILATAKCQAQTGVEMEALCASTVCALTIYDMLKALSHDIVILQTELVHKSGGRSGEIHRD